MREWLWSLEMHQRRMLAAVAAVVAVAALLTGALALMGDDDGGASAVETSDDDTLFDLPTTTSSTAVTTTSTTLAATSTSATAPAGTAAAGGGATTTSTTARRSSGGGTVTTQAPATTKPTTPPPNPRSGGPCNYGSGPASQMGTLYCQHRAGLGRPATSRNSALDGYAAEWAAKMAADHALSHRPNADAFGKVKASCSCPGWAEIVAYAPTIDEALSGWLASPTHRGHIEDPRDGEHGIGVAFDGTYYWVVQMFGYYTT